MNCAHPKNIQKRLFEANEKFFPCFQFWQKWIRFAVVYFRNILTPSTEGHSRQLPSRQLVLIGNRSLIWLQLPLSGKCSRTLWLEWLVSIHIRHILDKCFLELSKSGQFIKTWPPMMRSWLRGHRCIPGINIFIKPYGFLMQVITWTFPWETQLSDSVLYL